MGEKLLKLMKSEGLTSSRLAELLGTGASNISHIISGRSKPGYDLLRKILLSFPADQPRLVAARRRDDVSHGRHPENGCSGSARSVCHGNLGTCRRLSHETRAEGKHSADIRRSAAKRNCRFSKSDIGDRSANHRHLLGSQLRNFYPQTRIKGEFPARAPSMTKEA